MGAGQYELQLASPRLRSPLAPWSEIVSRLGGIPADLHKLGLSSVIWAYDSGHKGPQFSL